MVLFQPKTDFRRTLSFDPIEEVLQFTLDNVVFLRPTLLRTLQYLNITIESLSL